MDKIELGKVAEYITEKISVDEVCIEDYISTENMLPNKGGICLASNKPATGKVTRYQKGDILTSNIRPYFKKIWLADRDGGCSNDVLVIRNKQGYLPYYIYYVLSEDKFFDYSTASAKGTKMPRGDKTAIMQYLVPEHTIDNQERIIEILKNIDEKIRVNSKLNANLNSLIQLIYMKKYGEYYLNKENVPDDWEYKKISDIDVIVTDYVANGSFKTLADNVKYLSEETENILIRLTDYNNGYSGEFVYIDNTAYEFLSKSKLEGDEVIISNVGANVGTVFRCPRLDIRMSLAPNSIMIKSKMYEHYLFYHFCSPVGQQQLSSIVTGSAQPKFNKTNFRSLEILLPSSEEVEWFNNFVQPIYDEICNHEAENRRLEQMRDVLLLELMSGEIDLSEVQLDL